MRRPRPPLGEERWRWFLHRRERENIVRLRRALRLGNRHTQSEFPKFGVAPCPRSRHSRATNGSFFIVLAAESMLGASLDRCPFVPAFPAIAPNFSATNPAVQQSLTAYVFALAIMTLSTGTSSGPTPTVIASLVRKVPAASAFSLQLRWGRSTAFRFHLGLIGGAGSSYRPRHHYRPGIGSEARGRRPSRRRTSPYAPRLPMPGR